jgi:hypothetical protein
MKKKQWVCTGLSCCSTPATSLHLYFPVTLIVLHTKSEDRAGASAYHPPPTMDRMSLEGFFFLRHSAQCSFVDDCAAVSAKYRVCSSLRLTPPRTGSNIVEWSSSSSSSSRVFRRKLFPNSEGVYRSFQFGQHALLPAQRMGAFLMRHSNV